METTQQWRLKGHAKNRFWQWISSWARAVRKPSDLGFDDAEFLLPSLNVELDVLPSTEKRGFFSKHAITLNEQRAERIRTLHPRCEKVASLCPKTGPVLIWCHLNKEGDLLEKLIPDAIQVAGSDKEEDKERKLISFSDGKSRVLITKPKIAGFGLNWQHCSEVFYFPSWSHEQYYQAIRRCWRFGQKRQVNCRIVTSEAEAHVVNGMLRKERQSQEMYDGIIRNMKIALKSVEETSELRATEIPSWL